MSNTALQNLKSLFQDQPNVLIMLDLRELDLSNLTDKQLIEEQKKRKLYPEPINFYATGRTGAGKTSLGNSLLDSGQRPMESHGHIDCTSVVQYFALASNMRYYDLPGAGGNEAYENINRAALLIPQLDNEDEGMTPVNELKVLDFSDYPRIKPIQVGGKDLTVAHWQSPANQRYAAADIILYVVAPHMGFIRDDRRYLTALIKSQKERGSHNKVIFALNIHRNKDGTVKPTSQNIQDARTKITEIYQKFYSGTPPIVEIDSLRGIGINQITELMCQILPSEKIGNMQQVLRDELKQVAKKERSRRYRQALIYIASRLATYTVDVQLGNQGLLQEAYAAICNYGIKIFRTDDALAQAEKELYTLVDSVAAKAKISREEAIKVVEPVMGEKEQKQVIVKQTPKFEPQKVIDNVEGYVEVQESRTETRRVQRSAATRGAIGIGEAVFRTVFSPISIVQSAFGAQETVGDEIHRDFDRAAYKDKEVIVTENVMKPVKQTIERWENRFVGMDEEREEVVTGTYQAVVGQREKEVGKKSKQGGYLVIEDLLAIGLGLETADPSQDLRTCFDAVIQSGRSQVQSMLIRFKDHIDQLVESSNPEQAEVQIIKILERALTNQ